MDSNNTSNDHTAAFAEAFFMANLLFVGIFYIALWALYLLRYRHTTVIAQQHLRQTLIASSISMTIFIAMNIFILLTDGYASLTALFSLEVYFMLVVPLFLIAGIIGFSKAVQGLEFNYPLIGRFSK